MTVLDFRSGRYADPREGYAAQGDDAQAAQWTSRRAAAPDWQDEDDWDDSRHAGAHAARLTDRPGVLAGVARLTHYVGALVSVALMAALAIWGYQLVVRDVSGVPVIRAVEGDARVAPEEPGGELTDRTGLAVNNVAAGEKASPAERVAIAPAPTALDGQDVAMGELGASAQPPVMADEAPADDAPAVIAMTDAQASRQAAEQAAEQARAATPPVARIAPADRDADANGQELAITAALAEAGATPAVTTPTRPLPRPRRIAAANGAPAPAAAPVAPPAAPLTMAAGAGADAAQGTEAAPEAAPAPAPVRTAAVESGAPLVQIGAFDSGAIAESEWSRVSGRYSDLFSGKAPVVQEHKAGGRTFYRLRVTGFGSREDARKFCAALIAAGTDCIPAVAK